MRKTEVFLNIKIKKTYYSNKISWRQKSKNVPIILLSLYNQKIGQISQVSKSYLFANLLVFVAELTCYCLILLTVGPAINELELMEKKIPFDFFNYSLF